MLLASDIHPGEILHEEIMESHGLTAAELAAETGIALAELQAVIDETAPVTEQIAEKLGNYFELSKEFWLNLQRSYDMYFVDRPYPVWKPETIS